MILAVVIALVPQNTTRPYKLTVEQLLSEIRTGTQFISPDEVADKIVQKDPSIQLIDVRNPREFDLFSLPGAINIPLQDILSEGNSDILNQGTKMNIFSSNGSTEANEPWLRTRQLSARECMTALGLSEQLRIAGGTELLGGDDPEPGKTRKYRLQ